MVYNLGDKKVKFRTENYYIADNAVVLGDVEIGDYASVWFNAVIRGDSSPIIIGDSVNIQDGCVLHSEPWNRLEISEGVTVGHLAMIHGCIIGEYSLIGINSVILDDAVIGKNCIIGANTLIPEKKKIPDGVVVMGSPGKIVRDVTEVDIKILEASAKHYAENGRRFRDSLVQV